MNKIKRSASATRNFVSDHRVAIAVVVTLTVCTALQMRSAKEWNAFLTEHNLFDEFYAFEDVA